MDRIIWIEINGKNYPMCCTLGARKDLEAIYISMPEYLNKFEDPDKAVGAFIDGLEILIKYGARRAEMFEIEPIENAAVDGQGNYQRLTRQELEILLTPSETEKISSKILEAITVGHKKEIEAAPTKETRKN